MGACDCGNFRNEIGSVVQKDNLVAGVRNLAANLELLPILSSFGCPLLESIGSALWYKDVVVDRIG